MVLLSLSLLSGAHALSPDCPFGVNAHQASDASLDLVADAGIGWVRFDMNWFQMEPQPGLYDWTTPDRFVTHARQLGLNVFFTVAYTPDWAAPAGCDNNSADVGQHCLNAVPAQGDWTSFVTAAVERYGDHVKHWGMWNEPNLEHFFLGTRRDYVQTILKPGSAAVHAACSDCKVLGPELAHLRGANWDANSGTCLFGECSFNGWEVSLRAILDAAGSDIDIITHHKYTDPAHRFWSEAVDGEYVVVKLMSGIKEITDEHAPGKEVWITEMGWETTPGGSHTEGYAADQLFKAYQTMGQVQAGTWSGTSSGAWPELQKMFWYDLHDDPNTAPDGDRYTWGLLGDDGLTPKQTYASFATVVDTFGGCPDGMGGTTPGPTDTGTALDTDAVPEDTGPGATDTDGSPDPGGAPDEDADEDDAAAPVGAAGCACTSAGSGPASLGALALLGIATVRRRR